MKKLFAIALLAILLLAGAAGAQAATTGTVVLGWTCPADTTITNYDIVWGTASGKESAVVVVPGNATATGTVTGLSIPGTYYFVVESVNATGVSAPSNEVSVTFTAAGTVPAAPSGLRIISQTPVAGSPASSSK